MQRKKQANLRVRALLSITLLSILLSVGLSAYLFDQIVRELDAGARQRAQDSQTVSNTLTEAVVALANQTQEWKDMLLRAHDPALLSKHRALFDQDQQQFQAALTRTEAAMRQAGLDLSRLHLMQQQNQILLAEYTAGLALLDPKAPLSYRAADARVRGADRALRDNMQQLLRDTEQQSALRLQKIGVTTSASNGGKLYLLGGLGIILPLISFGLFFYIYRALREIAAGDARIRAIYEAIGDAVIVTDLAGQVQSLNQTAQRLTGWTQAEASGQPVSEVMPLLAEKDRRRIESPIERVLRDGQLVPMANGMILPHRSNGSETAIEDSAAPVYDDNQRMIGAVMVFHDVSERYALLRRLRAKQALFRQIFEQAAVGLAQVSAPDGRLLQVNGKLCEILGYTQDELLGLRFQDITHPEDLRRDLLKLESMLSGTLPTYQVEKRYIRKDGRIVWISLTTSLSRREDGSPEHFISVMQDIQARKDAELAAEVTQHQYQALFEQMPEGILLINRDLRVISCNREAQLQLEYSEAELCQLHVWDIEADEDAERVQQHAQKMRDTGKDEFESHYRTRSGQLIDVLVSVQRVSLPGGDEVFQCLFRDISEQKAATRQIEYLAYHDQLTGTANRRLLTDRLNQAISVVLRRGTQLGVLYLDLDRFKEVNDSLGHQFGDELLKVVSARLLECIRAEDTLARIGGDEFVVLLNEISAPDDAASVAQKIINRVAEPVRIGKEELRIGVSIGISVCPADGKDADDLLKYADAALYQAKGLGRGTYHLYTNELHRQLVERLQAEHLLRKAIEFDEFELYYQPKVNLEDSRITGCEALIRWNHPGTGLIPPMQFIPIAEQSNLIIEIGAWVIRDVCRQAARWQEQGHTFRVAFNVSARQFTEPEALLAQLRHAIAHSGVDARYLEVEITESLLIDKQSMNDALTQIREMGIHIALDDFGTGYSSLSYLKTLPINTLKIDRSFVSDADHDPDDAEMVKTIIGMGRNLRMELVAEGIETEGQRSLLSTYGCQLGQGYYFSRPLPRAEFEALLATR